jgi:NitT/TauT family transport system substrate-binding protein
MMARALAAWLAAALCSTALLAPVSPSAHAADLLKVAVAQRGQWDTAITEIGERSGMFKKRGIAVTILYTQGGPEAHQAVISGSMDIACGGGIESAIGAFSKGAPVRIIGSAMIGSPDTYWFVVANSPIKSLADASGKTISYSQNGSSSHTALLALLDQYKVDARPVATGGHPATLTMAMTSQIDIGRGAAPFGLDLVEEGKIRVIARGRRNQGTRRPDGAHLHGEHASACARRRCRPLHAGISRHHRLDVHRPRGARHVRGVFQCAPRLDGEGPRRVFSEGDAVA